MATFYREWIPKKQQAEPQLILKINFGLYWVGQSDEQWRKFHEHLQTISGSKWAFYDGLRASQANQK